MRSYVGENDRQPIRALALGLDWHSSPRVTSYFTFYIAPGFAFSDIQRTLQRGIGFIFYCYVFVLLFLLKDQFPVQFVLEIIP